MKNFKFIDTTKNVLDKFGPEILTGLGIIFTGLAIKSAIDSAEEAVEVKMKYRVEEKEFKEMTESSPDQDAVNKTLKTKKLQKNIELLMVYKWSLIFGTASAVCMICSTKLSGSKIAATYALAKLNEDKLKIALEKTKELFGEDGEKNLKDKMAEELIAQSDVPFQCTKNPNLEDPVFFEDLSTGAGIETSMENMLSAIETAKRELAKNHTLSYKKWWTIVGLPGDTCRLSNIGWNTFNPFDVEFVDMMVGSKPVKGIRYKNEPKTEFYHMTK